MDEAICLVWDGKTIARSMSLFCTGGKKARESISNSGDRAKTLLVGKIAVGMLEALMFIQPNEASLLARRRDY
jgi:hypothetical protein